MLNFHDVSVSYGKRTVLKQISFALTPGRITVLLGSNGAGEIHTAALCPWDAGVYRKDFPAGNGSENHVFR